MTLRISVSEEWRNRVHRATGLHIENVPTFYDILGQASGVVSGSTALAVLTSASRYERDWTILRDLDVYVPSLDSFGVMAHFLQVDEGYRACPVLADDLERYFEEPACIRSITRFRRRTGHVEPPAYQYIDLIVAKDGSATLPMTAFWGTLVMNYISSTGIVSLYPRLTLGGRGVENPNASKPRIRQGMTKYMERGFYLSEFVHEGFDCQKACSYCPSVLRYTEDSQCLHVIWSTHSTRRVLAPRSRSFKQSFSVTPSFWIWSRCPPTRKSSAVVGYAIGRL